MNARAWSSDEDEYLRREVLAGTSYARISDGLPGRTRNSCVGRANRLGIETPKPERVSILREVAPARSPINYRPLAARLKKLDVIRNPPAPKPVVVNPEGRNKLLMADLPRFGRCRFPLWADNAFPTVDGMFVCGEATKAVESAWCAFHHSLCFRPIPGAVK